MAGSSSALARFVRGLLNLLGMVRSVIFNLLTLVLLLGLAAALMGPPDVVIEDDSALLLDPAGTIVEQRSLGDPLSVLGSGDLEGSRQVVLADLLTAVRAAKDDNRISALVLSTDRLAGAGMAQLVDLGAALDDFRQSGKKIYAIADSFREGSYLLASHADEILMNNFGSVDLQGFGLYQNYLQDPLSKLGINAHVFRVGEYKSAVEPYLRADMSPETRENYGRLVGDLWRHYAGEVETRRSLPAGTLDDYIANLPEHLAEYRGNSADLAVALGLVDRIDSRHALADYLREQVGSSNDELRGISYRRYLATDPRPAAFANDKVAIVVAEGEIVDGESGPGRMGGDTLAQEIRAVTEDARVKALVLRVNSPGGSAFASEVIRSELAAFKASGRPIVVSMGDLAASGGYWISTPADQIWASPVTLTGSIGIFALAFTFEEALAKLGIGTDGVGSSPLAGVGTLGLPLPETMARAIQLSIENGYQQFIGLVAESRDLDLQQVDAVAQGQVWSGTSARGNGLVDEIGGLDQAIRAAAGLAKLEDYQVDVREPEQSPAQQFLQEILDSAMVREALEPWLASLSPAGSSLLLQGLQRIEGELDWLRVANDPQHRYLRCLACSGLEWR
jgi:protease-4